MATWVTIIGSVLAILAGGIGYLRSRQGTKAGQAQAENEAFKEQADSVEKANAARAESERKSADGGLRDDDGFKRG